MPYVTQPQRQKFQKALGLITEQGIKDPGELNFLISVLCITYFENKGLNYQHINDVKGALTCAADEFYRKVAIPYEEKKIEINGDLGWPKHD